MIPSIATRPKRLNDSAQYPLGPLRLPVQNGNSFDPATTYLQPSIDPKTGLSPGYDAKQWGPWKSHSLLLQQYLAANPKAGVALLRIFRAASKDGKMNFIDFEGVFKRYMRPTPAPEQVLALFTLFDRNQDGVLNESDFLAGMIAASPNTLHALDKPSGQLRMQYLFLFYDSDRDGTLRAEELSLLFNHLIRAVGQENKRSPRIGKEAPSCSTALLKSDGNFGYSAFFDAVQSNRLNGTSQLLRLSADLVQAAAAINPGLFEGVSTVKVSMTFGGTLGKLPVMGLEDGVKNDTVEVQALASVPSPGLPSQTDAPAVATPPSIEHQTPSPARKCRHARPSIIDPLRGYHTESRSSVSSAAERPQLARVIEPLAVIQPPSIPGMEIPLRIVRYLMDISSNRTPIDWPTLSVVSSNELKFLADSVKPLLAAEDSLVELSLPCRVYGDIHGQLADLLQFFNSYSWPDKRRGDILSMNYVFLGDFVDRGCYSVEVVALLFSLKLLYPSKVFLIRGNHEDRAMNALFGFRGNCRTLFGEADGDAVWDAVNAAFDHLPIAALIDSEVLCIHGGIGENINSLSDLKGIPKPILVPGESEGQLNKTDKIVIDALWSDPTDNDKILGVHLSPRGQGACRFGPDRVEDFCLRNRIKLIVRAHECVQAGYEYFAGGRLLTVFSATSYCNIYSNDAAMIVLIRNRSGEIEEHAQVLKSGNPDTRIGWSGEQFRQPSPLRGRV